MIEDSLGYLVNRAGRLMAHELADRLRPTGVGIGQWAVLLFLWARDGTTQAELARVVAIEPPTSCAPSTGWSETASLSRSSDANDARLTRIHLTDRGRALRDELVSEAVAVNKSVKTRLTATEYRKLHRLLAKLVAEPTARQTR